MVLKKKIAAFCLLYFLGISLSHGFVDYFQMRPGRKKKNCLITAKLFLEKQALSEQQRNTT